MSYPQRIYVLPAQPRQLVKRPVPTERIVAELLGDEMGPTGPRKRERLSHLTQEEKMERRKLKNRVAAQNARDKKKDRSAKIEDVMRDLVEENRRLRAENEMLRRQCQENQEQQEEDQKVYSNVVYEEEVVAEQHRAFESAAFISEPLPWEQARLCSKTTPTSVDKYLTILSILCNQLAPTTTSTSSTSNSTSKDTPTLDTSRTEATATRRAVPRPDRSLHLLKHVKHFRRVP